MRGILLLKGGPTSGNWGHAGRPGKVGGSDKGGGFGRLSGFRPDLTPDELRQEAAKQSAELKKRKALAKIRLRDSKKLLDNYDTDKIIFGGPGYDFEVGNDQFIAAGDYNPETNKIRLFDSAFSEDMRGIYLGVVAHEIQHERFAKFMSNYESQHADMIKRLHQEVADGVNWRDSFMRADGSFKTEDDKQRYSAVALHYKYFTNGDDINTLQNKDGITDYSKSYWKQYDDYGKTDNFFRAVNETISEVARARLEFVDGLKSVDPLWVELYNAINDEAAKND